MFIPKTQKWEIKDGGKVHLLSLSSPAFVCGNMKFKVDETEFILKPLKPVSFGFKRDEEFKLGDKAGVLKIAANGDAKIFIGGKEVPVK